MAAGIKPSVEISKWEAAGTRPSRQRGTMLVTPGCHYISDNGMSLEGWIMAMPVSGGAKLEVRLEGKLYAQQVMNVLHYKLVSSSETMEGRDVINSAHADFNGVTGLFQRWAECMSEDCINLKVFYQWIHPSRFSYIEKAMTATEGLVEELACSPQVTSELVKRSDLTGRHQRGSLHVPALPITWEEGGLLTDLARSNLQAFGNKTAFVVDPDEGWTLQPIIYDRVTPNNSPIITNVILKPEARALVRRTVGRGS